MATKLNPYLTFAGKARSALEFYATVFGGEPTMQTYQEMGMATRPEQGAQIMHGQLITPDGLTLMASDDPEGTAEGKNVSIAISGEDETSLTGYFEKLAEGGMTVVPMARQMWGDMFGMCFDKFGIRWMVNILAPKA